MSNKQLDILSHLKDSFPQNNDPFPTQSIRHGGTMSFQLRLKLTYSEAMTLTVKEIYTSLTNYYYGNPNILLKRFVTYSVHDPILRSKALYKNHKMLRAEQRTFKDKTPYGGWDWTVIPYGKGFVAAVKKRENDMFAVEFALIVDRISWGTRIIGAFKSSE